MRVALATVAIVALAGPASAQSPVELAEPPASVAIDLASLGPVDRVRPWTIDWNADGQIDLLVQAAFVAGGNSVYLRHFIYTARDGAYAREVELEIGDGIRSVTWHDGTYLLDIAVYLDSDARCCPSGSRTMILAP